MANVIKISTIIDSFEKDKMEVERIIKLEAGLVLVVTTPKNKEDVNNIYVVNVRDFSSRMRFVPSSSRMLALSKISKENTIYERNK